MARILQIKVKPNSRQSSLAQADDGIWLAHIKSPPVDGKANQELCALVAAHVGCAKSLVSIKTGSIENDPSYCTGSRAICMSRRSQEILGWVGVDKPLVDKGLSWVGGRSYYRDTEVLHFQMPHDPTQRFAPMVNIQQYFAEQYAHEAARKYADLVDVRWNCTVKAVREVKNGNKVDVTVSDGRADGKTQTIHADWLVACDGGRSTVREQLGLQL